MRMFRVMLTQTENWLLPSVKENPYLDKSEEGKNLTYVAITGRLERKIAEDKETICQIAWHFGMWQILFLNEKNQPRIDIRHIKYSRCTETCMKVLMLEGHDFCTVYGVKPRRN